MIDIVVVDDDKLVAVSLKTILEASGEIKVAALGSGGMEAMELYNKHRPDILLMDIRMEPMTGLEAAEVILKEDAEAKILFLTTFSDDEYIIKTLSIGAKGYLLKQDFAGIVPALKAVMSGQSVFGGEIVGKLPNLVRETAQFDYTQYQLGGKEQEIMALVADGLNNKEIASKLCLSEGTVRNYLSVILEKLGLRDRTQLAVFYLKHCC